MIAARDVDKRYGSRTVLRGVTFDLERGALMLVTGPNGSGKTTLLRLLVGLAVPTRGSIAVTADRAGIGYATHESLLYRELTALENLELFGRLYRVRERKETIGMLLERFGLWDARGERVGDYSRGMVQRLSLCRALLHAPELLVLDEPFTSLDHDGAALLDHELAALAGRSTVVVSTHDPQRVAGLASATLALAAM
jgi:ABC-type multidrug transport system ATPase subunit